MVSIVRVHTQLEKSLNLTLDLKVIEFDIGLEKWQKSVNVIKKILI